MRPKAKTCPKGRWLATSIHILSCASTTNPELLPRKIARPSPSKTMLLSATSSSALMGLKYPLHALNRYLRGDDKLLLCCRSESIWSKFTINCFPGNKPCASFWLCPVCGQSHSELSFRPNETQDQPRRLGPQTPHCQDPIMVSNLGWQHTESGFRA